MFIPFDQLPEHSRIWIYQSGHELSDEECLTIKNYGETFVNEWTAHQQTLHASFEILHATFLILAVDEKQNDASGCSIDKSVYFIKEIENKFNLSLFDRYNIAFRIGEKVAVKSLDDFLKMVKEEKLTTDLRVFNNLIQTKADLKTNWEIPLRESWVMMKIN